MEQDKGSELFGAQRPAEPPKRKWLRRLVTLCSILLVLAACAEILRRTMHYGQKVVEANPVDARIEISNPPAWLDRRIVEALLDESYQFAQRDQATYDRARNIMDAGILREFAEVYTGTDVVDGKSVNRQASGYNAWIRKVTEVRRDIAPGKTSQTIRIFAEWRQPVAWVRVREMLYLIDAEGTRLPGDYHLEDRAKSRLMVVTGVDLPRGADGAPAVPQPGETWASGSGSMGGDLVAGLRLVNALHSQPFAPQIDAIDVANYQGRKDARTPWVVLNTVFTTADGTPRVVQWGRTIGDEKFYDVNAAVKVKTLNELFVKFNRIDAGRDYVDIHTEVLRLSKLSSQAETPAATPRG